MSTTYTGVPANIGAPGSVTNATAITETIPADGDPLNVASINAALQKQADYVSYVLQGGFVGSGASPGISGTGGATNGKGVVGQGTGTAAGVGGTGGASGPGGAFVAGGGNSPVAGSVNLGPTTNAPSAPSNGDLWMTTAGVLGARANGNTRTIALLEAVQTWTAVQTFAPSAATPGILTSGGAGQEGVRAFGGSSSGTGVLGTGGSPDGVGVSGQGIGAGPGVLGIGSVTAGSIGVQAKNGVNDAWCLQTLPTASATRGSLNLGPQTSATNCKPGDMWWDGTNFKVCKVAGTAITLI